MAVLVPERLAREQAGNTGQPVKHSHPQNICHTYTHGARAEPTVNSLESHSAVEGREAESQTKYPTVTISQRNRHSLDKRHPIFQAL